MIMAIALCIFVEFEIQIRQMVELQKSSLLEAKVLQASGVSGILFGGLASLLGGCVIADSYKLENRLL